MLSNTHLEVRALCPLCKKRFTGNIDALKGKEEKEQAARVMDLGLTCVLDLSYRGLGQRNMEKFPVM